MVCRNIWAAAGLEWITFPSREKATTPSVIWRNRVSSLLRSFSTCRRVSCSWPAMSLKVSVKTPISSWDTTSIFREKSRSATRMAPSVSFWMGVTMVLDSRKDSRMEMTRPNTSASAISRNSWLVSPLAMALLSRM